ncbi:MAG: hypothetical protein KBB83_07085 [Alphaproteobacteria bacterium]|nr:hypothetical protein [Alphaproteobacteria bacterium]
MRGDLKIRKISALSEAKAVQIVRYVDRKCVVIRHVGRAKTEIELDVLMKEAERLREELCLQPSLFPETRHDKPLLHEKNLSL